MNEICLTNILLGKIESIKYSVYFKLQISDNLGVEKLLLRKIVLLWYATSYDQDLAMKLLSLSFSSHI